MTIVERREARPEDEVAFMSLHRLTIVNEYDDGTRSAPYIYDAVLRRHLDAVVLILLAEVDGRESVLLRSSIRPPLLLRQKIDTAIPDERVYHTIWELPAGLLEDDDRGEAGVFRRAALEALEETGYRVGAGEFRALAGRPFMSPGTVPERFCYVMARVADPGRREEPPGDGSPAEDGAGVWWVPLDEALAMCDRGEIEDVKTELGVRRVVALRETGGSDEESTG